MSLAFDVQHHFSAPPERVFAGLTDLDAARDWMEGFVRIEKRTDGPFGVGTVWRETRKMFGREATEEFDVVEVDAPRRLALHVDGTKGSSRKGEYRFVYVLTPRDGGTDVALHGEIDGMGWFGRLFGRLMMGPFRSACLKDMQSLAAHMEREQAAPVA